VSRERVGACPPDADATGKGEGSWVMGLMLVNGGCPSIQSVGSSKATPARKVQVGVPLLFLKS
jgi:hypothetical protein